MFDFVRWRRVRCKYYNLGESLLLFLSGASVYGRGLSQRLASAHRVDYNINIRAEKPSVGLLFIFQLFPLYYCKAQVPRVRKLRKGCPSFCDVYERAPLFVRFAAVYGF